MRHAPYTPATRDFQAIDVSVQDSPDPMVGCGPSRYVPKLKDLDLSTTHVAMWLYSIQLSAFKSEMHIAIRLVGRKGLRFEPSRAHHPSVIAVSRQSVIVFIV
jgi:hypothetical protein